MKIYSQIKKVLCFLLVLSMVLQYIPMVSYAAIEDNICQHHPEHTVDCGYVEGVSVCAYHCDECLVHDHDQVPEVSCDCETDDAHHATS